MDTKARRDFLKQSATVLGGLGLIKVLTIIPSGAFGQSNNRRGKSAAVNLELIDPNDALAKAVNYQHSHDDVKNNALKIERGGLVFKDQFCDNCSLYTKTSEDNGRCTIFPNKLVKAKGWCNSWNKKPT